MQNTLAPMGWNERLTEQRASIMFYRGTYLLRSITLGLFLVLSYSIPGLAQSCNGQLTAGSVCGNPGLTTALPVATINPVLGKPGTSTGTLGLGATAGGTATITPPAIAGNTALQLPSLAGTLPSTAASPIVLNPTTGALTCPTCETSPSGVAPVLDPVDAASIGSNVNISSAPASLDGVSGVSGHRWLLKDQSTTSQNGIYQFNGTGNALTRTSDFNTTSQVVQGTSVRVTQGTLNSNSTWYVVTANPITIESTSIAFGNSSNWPNAQTFGGTPGWQFNSNTPVQLGNQTPVVGTSAKLDFLFEQNPDLPLSTLLANNFYNTFNVYSFANFSKEFTATTGVAEGNGVTVYAYDNGYSAGGSGGGALAAFQPIYRSASVFGSAGWAINPLCSFDITKGRCQGVEVDMQAFNAGTCADCAAFDAVAQGADTYGTAYRVEQANGGVFTNGFYVNVGAIASGGFAFKLSNSDFTVDTSGNVVETTAAIGAGSAITSSGPGGALGSNAFTSTAYLPIAGGTMGGNIAMGSNAITGAGASTFSSINLSGTFIGVGATFNTTGSNWVKLNSNSASVTPLQFIDANTGGKTWSVGPGVGTTSAALFGIYNTTDSNQVLTISSGGNLAVTGGVLANGASANTAYGMCRTGTFAGCGYFYANQFVAFGVTLTSGSSDIFNVDPSGNTKAFGTMTAAGVFISGSSSGVSCSGVPSVSFASVGGIVTHC